MDLQWIYWYILHSPDIFSIIMVQIDPPARVHLFGASLSFISMSDELADFYFLSFLSFLFLFSFCFCFTRTREHYSYSPRRSSGELNETAGNTD